MAESPSCRSISRRMNWVVSPEPVATVWAVEATASSREGKWLVSPERNWVVSPLGAADGSGAGAGSAGAGDAVPLRRRTGGVGLGMILVPAMMLRKNALTVARPQAKCGSSGRGSGGRRPAIHLTRVRNWDINHTNRSDK